MFNYSFNIRKLNSNSSLKAFVTLIIDDVMSVEGFKIVDGRNGLFVSVPSHKGTVMEDGNKVDKYFDDVRFLGDEGLEVGTEIKDAMLNAYQNENHSNSSQRTSVASQQETRANAAAANSNAMNSNNAPKKRRQPLWDDT